MAPQQAGQPEAGARPKSRFRRFLRGVAATLILVGILLFIFASVFIASPFEGALEDDLVDLVPANSPVYLRAREMHTWIEWGRRSVLWKRLVDREEWRDLMPGPEVEGASEVRAALEDLAEHPERLLVAKILIDDLLGEDTAIVAAPGADGEDHHIAVLTRVGYSTRFLFGCAELFGVRMGLLTPERAGGVRFERIEPGHLVARGVPGVEELHVARIRDVLVVSTYRKAIGDILYRLAGGETRPLSGRHLFQKTMEPFGELGSDSRLKGFVDCDVLASHGIDLEKIVTGLLGQDLRSMAFESMDFAGWRSVGLAVAPDADESVKGIEIEMTVALDPERGERSAQIADLYSRAPRQLTTLDVLPVHVAAVKTATLPFNRFFSLIFENLEQKTREDINYYVLDQLQGGLVEVDPKYKDLINYLTVALDEEFTVFGTAAGYAETDELLGYLPRIGIAFPTRDSEAIVALIKDTARVLPQINPDLFTTSALVEREHIETGALIFPVQAEFAPLYKLYKITPTFIVTKEFIVLVTSQDLVEPVLASLASRSGMPGIRIRSAHSLVHVSGQDLHDVLVDSWMDERLRHLGMEEVFRAERREELMKERMVLEGKRTLIGKEREEWGNWADDQLDEPHEARRLAERMKEYLAPRRDAWMAALAPLELLGGLTISARYSPDRIYGNLRLIFADD